MYKTEVFCFVNIAQIRLQFFYIKVKKALNKYIIKKV